MLDDPPLVRCGERKLRLSDRLAIALKSMVNIHRRGLLPDIFLFATPRGGSTWALEIIGSQARMKIIDEPLNPRRLNVAYSGLFPDFAALMPDTGDSDAIISYLRELQSGKRRHMNPTPFRRHHHLVTERTVFKIHEVEHLIEAIEQSCGAMVVYLLRHPIATSISRKVLPRLELFLQSKHYANLIDDPSRLTEIRRLADNGSHLQKSLVSWCFENLIPLQQPGTGWLFVTYEELVLNPIRSCALLAKRLQLRDQDRVLAAFERPAANIRMSRETTLKAMQHPDARERRRLLVTKWQREVTAADLEAAALVLSLFRIDAYTAASALPHSRLLHFEDTARLLSES